MVTLEDGREFAIERLEMRFEMQYDSDPEDAYATHCLIVRLARGNLLQPEEVDEIVRILRDEAEGRYYDRTYSPMEEIESLYYYVAAIEYVTSMKE